MYTNYPNIVFGFHVCESTLAEKLVTKKINLRISNNSYDWLGAGMYFWENSPDRAKIYGEELKKLGKLKNPVVVGAAISLGHCLDLLDSGSLKLLKASYDTLIKTLKAAGEEVPANTPGSKKRSSGSDDLLLRILDCAVINFLHAQRKQQKLRPFDSVRGVFWEGEPLYPTAGFKEKNHVQIAVTNPNCIKGYFWPRTEDQKHLGA